MRLTWVWSYLSSLYGPEPIGLRLVSDGILSGAISLNTAFGTISALARKFLTKFGLYGLDLSLISILRGSVAVIESMYCQIVEKLTRAVLPSSKVKTTSSAVRSEPSDHLVPSCSGSVNVRSSGCSSSLARPGDERAVEQVEPQQALVDELALVRRRGPVGRSRERVEALRRAPLEAGDEQRLPGRAGTTLRWPALYRFARCRRPIL